MLRVKTVTVAAKDQEPFDAQLQKAIQGMDVRDIKYSFTIIGDTEVRSALILYNA